MKNLGKFLERSDHNRELIACFRQQGHRVGVFNHTNLAEVIDNHNKLEGSQHYFLAACEVGWCSQKFEVSYAYYGISSAEDLKACIAAVPDVSINLHAINNNQLNSFLGNLKNIYAGKRAARPSKVAQTSVERRFAA